MFSQLIKLRNAVAGTITIASGSLTIYEFLKMRQEHKNTIERLESRMHDLEKLVQTKGEKIAELTINSEINSINSKIFKTAAEEPHTHLQELLKSHENGSGLSDLDKALVYAKSQEKFRNLDRLYEEFWSKSKYTSDGSIIDKINEYYSIFKDYLSTLSIEQVGALGHIILLSWILYTILNIIAIYYGDILIRYFKLEEKYPKIAKLIQIRRKFLEYYIKLNILLIILVLVLLLYTNFVVFFY